ncbi:MAG: hypothetical protein KQI81_24385 [Deltaproteobacteria bacterium]|nr:hypothetical protein [Deltaproteobacteria bacterium]
MKPLGWAGNLVLPSFRLQGASPLSAQPFKRLGFDVSAVRVDLMDDAFTALFIQQFSVEGLGNACKRGGVDNENTF